MPDGGNRAGPQLGNMKRTIVGRVKSNESRDVTKVKSEGVGDNRTEHVVREKAYYLRVLDEDGLSVNIRSPDPFDVIVGQDMSIEMKAQKQRKIEEE